MATGTVKLHYGKQCGNCGIFSIVWNEKDYKTIMVVVYGI